MAEKPDDLDIPKMLARASAQPSLPPRVSDLTRPRAVAPDEATKDPPAAAPSSPREPRSMIVGRDIVLSGDIRSCNRLVVEGTLEATLHDCRDIEIAESGLFRGNAAIEQAEIRGQFEGELVVRNRLVIRATGHVSGTVTYGEIEIERGGKVSGVIQEAGPVPYFGNVRAASD
jgi:cytoskeletal protein CcmA (bactofilin family)